MHEEQYMRVEAGVAPVEQPSETAVESVPSEQLWRAAVLAARQAAVSAAELRRAFEASTASASDDTGETPLVS